MNIRYARPETDISGISRIVNAFELEHVTDDSIRQWFVIHPPGQITQRKVATTEADEVIGYSVCVHENWQPEGQFYVWVGMDAAWRGKGGGLELLHDAQAFLSEQKANSLTSEVRDDDPAALRFAERNGFRVDRHLFASTLDLTTFNDSIYAGLIEAQANAGIRFFSLADCHDSTEARRKLHTINSIAVADIPGMQDSFMPFDEFELRVCGSKWYRPEGQLVAAEGDTWVGLSAVMLLPETKESYNLITGVLPSYRGRKIALALKLLAIDYARSHGARTMITHNDSMNAPMLAINRKLGYQAQPGKFSLRKEAI